MLFCILLVRYIRRWRFFVLLLMIVAPLMAIGRYGDGAWAWSLLGDDYMRWRIGWTVGQALITCVLVLLIGTPLAWVLARFDFAGRALVLRLLMLPFVMSIIALIVMSRRVAYPRALMVPYRKGER